MFAWRSSENTPSAKDRNSRRILTIIHLSKTPKIIDLFTVVHLPEPGPPDYESGALN
jgi:hypothetical protein